MGYRRQSPQPVIEGGTGKQSNTAYAVLCGGTGAGLVTTPIQSIASVGTAGQLLTSNGAGALPTFQAISGTTVVSTLTGNSGGAVSPILGNITVIGTGSITVVGNPGTHTLTVTPGVTIPTSFVTDSGTAIPSANIINIKANPTAQTCGKTVQFTGSSNTVQLNVSDSNQNTMVGFGAGGAVLTGTGNTGFGYGAANSVSNGSFNTVMGFGAADALTSGSRNTVLGSTAAPIISTATNNTIVGEDACSNITTGSNNIVIGRNAGDSITTNSVNTLIGSIGVAGTTQFFAIDAGAGGTTFMHNYPGVSGITSTTGGNLFFGRDSGNFTLSGATDAGNNAFGEASLNVPTTANRNNAFGCFALELLSTGSRNTSIGNASGSGLISGSNNTFIGDGAGVNYASSESSNVLINSSGIPNESNTLRIGSGQGTGIRQLNRAFIQGIRGITPSAGDAIPVVIDSNGQLGTDGSGGSYISFVAYLTNPLNFPSSVNTQIIYDTLQSNLGGAFNLGTSVFTAPISGLYNFSICIEMRYAAPNPARPALTLICTGSKFRVVGEESLIAAGTAVRYLSNNIYVNMTAGDTAFVSMFFNSGVGTYTIDGLATDSAILTFFSGTIV
jgi:hypothetical protein